MCKIYILMYASYAIKTKHLKTSFSYFVYFAYFVIIKYLILSDRVYLLTR